MVDRTLSSVGIQQVAVRHPGSIIGRPYPARGALKCATDESARLICHLLPSTRGHVDRVKVKLTSEDVKTFILTSNVSHFPSIQSCSAVVSEP